MRTGENLGDPSVVWWPLFGYGTEGAIQETNMWWAGLHSNSKLLFCKRQYQENEKISHRLGGRMFAKYTPDKRLLFKIYKELLHLKNKKITWLKNEPQTWTKKTHGCQISTWKGAPQRPVSSGRQVSTTRRHHCTRMRMVPSADGDGRAVGTRTRCWWGCNVAQPLRKMGASLTKLDTTVLYNPATVRLGTYPKNMRT